MSELEALLDRFEDLRLDILGMREAVAEGRKSFFICDERERVTVVQILDELIVRRGLSESVL